ncbi:hypothetical protein [Clostridium sp. Marseille-P3244]|uniref:hypothetical protein n=1 Tax=Clostridium sp. Marseille-P3244 TaxID=1871020 RepID=UPI0009314580|nr:hypothetical protein [Clostridium sp. Marseille-P3244]
MKTELSIIPAYREPPAYRRKLIQHKRKKRDFASAVVLVLAYIGAGFVAGITFTGIVLLYCLQAGPI